MPSRISVALELQNSNARRSLEEIIGSHGDFVVKPPGAREGTNILVLDLDEVNPEKTFSAIQANLKGFPKTEVFLTCPKIESEVLLKALRAGVKEIIPQPITSEEVEQIFARYRERWANESSEEPKERGQVFSIIGAKGGVGATTVTVNLGIGLQKRGKSVALVDLNFQSSDLPILLDLEPPRTLKDVARNISRLDNAFLNSCFCRHESGLSLLSGADEDLAPFGEKEEQRGRMTVQCLERLMELLQPNFNFVLLDCGNVIEPRTSRVLELSNIIFLVLTLKVPVIRRTQKLLATLQGRGIAKEKIKLIVNAYNPDSEVLLKETEETLQVKAFRLIPEDFPTAGRAINGGVPLTMEASRAPITKTYHTLAGSFTEMMNGKNPVPRSVVGNYLQRLKMKWS